MSLTVAGLLCCCFVSRRRSRSFAACARVLKGGAPPPLRELRCRPSSAAMYAVSQTQLAHAEYWPVRLLLPAVTHRKRHRLWTLDSRPVSKLQPRKIPIIGVSDFGVVTDSA